MTPSGPSRTTGPRVLLASNDRLGLSVERWLRARGAAISFLSGAPGVQSGALSAESLASVAALVLTADDDTGNVDLALTACRHRPDLPLVVRIFDPTLAAYLRTTLAGIHVLSMSGVAAPAFAEAAFRALGGVAPASRIVAPRRQPGSWASRPGGWGARVDRVVVLTALVFFVVVAASTIYFGRVLRLSPLDALYFVWTTVMTVGYGDISLRDASAGAKVVGMGLMFFGAAFIASVFAFLNDWLVSRHLDVIRGRVRVRRRGHAVLVGGGNVGVRVAERLAGHGMKVAVLERDADNRNVSALRAAGHHVIIADATDEQMLRLAGLERAAVLLTLTDLDRVNLHVMLLARGLGFAAPIVMRLDSPWLSGHVCERSDATALAPIDMAAEAFGRAALEAAGAGSSSGGSANTSGSGANTSAVGAETRE